MTSDRPNARDEEVLPFDIEGPRCASQIVG